MIFAMILAKTKTSLFSQRARRSLVSFTSILVLGLSGCATPQKTAFRDTQQRVIISIPEQRLVFLENGKQIATYPISSAKNGIGDTPGSFKTPSGKLEIADKIGDGLPLGSVLKDRVPTGEVIGVDAPSRDPIVSRILWLRGLEDSNRNAYERFIYIHGTPQESQLGTPTSFGCIRMRSVDIATLYEIVKVGAQVWIVEDSSENAIKAWGIR
jgi:lipoprotein-anchoring transpeptidase ErfK/SrfK